LLPGLLYPIPVAAQSEDTTTKKSTEYLSRLLAHSVIAPVILPTPQPTPIATPRPRIAAKRANAPGNREKWLQESGIPEKEWVHVEFLVSRESGWNPCAYNPGKSDCTINPKTACGLVQQNPCGKIPGHWTDPVAALKWQYTYVNNRYGSYAKAVGHHRINNWY